MTANGAQTNPMESQAAQPAPEAPQALEAHLARVESFAREIIRHGGFDLTAAVRGIPAAEKEIEGAEFVVDFAGPDAGLLLERNGELLNALEYVVLRAVRLDEHLSTRITFDCEDWRQLHVEELKLMAQVAADRVAESGASFVLGAMNPRERRVIHLALHDRSEVRTASEGFGPERHIVIFPAAEGGRD
jgi:predicted RNA-binding protein Jag